MNAYLKALKAFYVGCLGEFGAHLDFSRFPRDFTLRRRK